MDQIGASKARTHLSRLLNHVARGESVPITRYGKPVARLVPVPGDRDRAKEAAARIVKRRRHAKCVPLADLMETVHEGQQH